MADLALIMLADIGKFSLNGKDKCTVRVGIHVGPVIAGVIGSKKFLYDVWGDALIRRSEWNQHANWERSRCLKNFITLLKQSLIANTGAKMKLKAKDS